MNWQKRKGYKNLNMALTGRVSSNGENSISDAMRDARVATSFFSSIDRGEHETKIRNSEIESNEPCYIVKTRFQTADLFRRSFSRIYFTWP
jgi:hypothetical protein